MAGLHWIDIPASGRLSIMARPRSGDWLENEIDNWVRASLRLVVSLLEKDEIDDLGLQLESKLCRDRGINFVSFPIGDRSVPKSMQETANLCGMINENISIGNSIAIHCRAGIGRSSLVAACALLQMGLTADDALARIRHARGVPVPDTDEQLDWIKAFGNRNGA